MIAILLAALLLMSEIPHDDTPVATDTSVSSNTSIQPIEHEETNAPDEMEENGVSTITSFADMQKVIVKSFDELKAALENDNGVTTVYFGADIAMQGGIRINPKKKNIVIDGLDPSGIGHTFTDRDSASFYDTVYIDAAGVQSLHIRNLTIVGKNYYGPFGVADFVELAGVELTYERVDYNGPQMGYHRRGTVRFIDCTARIHGGNGILSPNQEFSEVKHLVFKGVNSIDTVTSAYTVFWHPLGGTFTVSDDAVLKLNSSNTSAAFGVFFADSYLYKVGVTVGKCAVLDMSVSGVVAPELYVTLENFTIKEIGEFRLTSTKKLSESLLRIGGALTVEKEAVFHITGDCPALLQLTGGTLLCDDPSSVLFYNTSRDIRGNSQISISAQQVNYYNEIKPQDSPPLYGWRKTDGTNLTINGTLGANGEFSNLSSNYEGTPAPDTSTFSMANARILAFGRLELLVTEPTAQSKVISGVTAPGAVVRCSFTQQDTDYTFPDVISDSSGVFHIPINVTLESGTVVNVKSMWQYLTAEASEIVGGGGELEFFVPQVMEFIDTEISALEVTAKRLNPHWKIVVSDNREVKGGWNLYARLACEIAPVSGDLPVLTETVIFADRTGQRSVISQDSDQLIFASEGLEDVTTISWDNYEGVLLAIKPGTAFCETPYTGLIMWTFVNAP